MQHYLLLTLFVQAKYKLEMRDKRINNPGKVPFTRFIILTM